MTLGERIRRQREKLNKTQDEVAKAAGTTKQTIYKYEAGIVTNIPLDKLSVLASALETTPASLLGWEKPTEDGGLLKEFDRLFGKLSDEKKAVIIAIMRAMQE